MKNKGSKILKSTLEVFIVLLVKIYLFYSYCIFYICFLILLDVTVGLLVNGLTSNRIENCMKTIKFLH